MSEINEKSKKESPLDFLSEDQKKDLERIEEMQKSWSEAVAVKSKETMADLLLQGLVPIVRGEDGAVIACFYEKPLNNENDKEKRVYRIGGLVSDRSFEAKRALFDLAAQETEKFSSGFGTAIFNTRNSRIVKRLTELGWIEVTYEECRMRYPRELELYLKDSGIPEENYRNEKFYVLKK